MYTGSHAPTQLYLQKKSRARVEPSPHMHEPFLQESVYKECLLHEIHICPRKPPTLLDICIHANDGGNHRGRLHCPTNGRHSPADNLTKQEHREKRYRQMEAAGNMELHSFVGLLESELHITPNSGQLKNLWQDTFAPVFKIISCIVEKYAVYRLCTACNGP